MTTPLHGTTLVFEAHAANPAIVALEHDLPGAITDALFDRGELTLTIARDLIREAAAVVQRSGYNFLEDVTCVDWTPAIERFQVTYHIISHRLKQRIRLISFVNELDLEIASITGVWPS